MFLMLMTIKNVNMVGERIFLCEENMKIDV